MDLQTGSFCVFIAILSAIIIYKISISSVKENSFEEAKAIRKKMMKQYFEENRQSSEKAKEKKSKKAKKAKEKHSSDEKNVNYPDVDPQTEDEKENSQDVNKVQSGLNRPANEDGIKLSKVKDDSNIKRDVMHKEKIKDSAKHTAVKDASKEVTSKSDGKESKKSKRINNSTKTESLIKEEKGLKDSTKLNTILDSTSGSQKENTQNPAKNGPLPSSKGDAVSVAKVNDSSVKNEEASSNENKIIKQDVNSQETVPETPTTQLTVKETSSKPVPSNNKGGKKKKNDVVIQQLRNEKDAVNISLLMPLLQKAELSKSEIQLLIDVLLNKQQEESSEWLLVRQDPLVKLKKQLAEKEQALTNEQQATVGLQSKLKELRAELNSAISAARSMEENVGNKQNECVALSVKLKKAAEENQALVVKTQKLQQQLNEEHLLITQLKEEQAMQPQLHIAQEQQQHEIHTLKTHVNQLAGQLQELQSIKNDLANENAVLQERIRISEGCTADLNHSLNSALMDTKRFQDQTVEDRKEIEKLGKLIQSLQSDNQILQEKSEQLSKQVLAACQEQRRLVEVNEALIAKESKENGDLNYSQKQEELRKVIDEKEASILKLHGDIKEKENFIEKLNSDIIICKNEANKKQTILDNASSEISNLKAQVVDLLFELTEKKNRISQLVNESSAREEEVLSLEKEIELHKQRNNELRNKNWKVVEALAKAEQALQNMSRENQSSFGAPEQFSTSEFKLRITQLLQRLFPDISIPDSKDCEIWLKKLEDTIQEVKHHPPATSDCESDLEIQNRHLQTMLDHYKIVINETEGILKSLQANVEVEETRWGEKFQAQQEEIDLLKSKLLKVKCSENEVPTTTENGSQEIQ